MFQITEAILRREGQRPSLAAAQANGLGILISKSRNVENVPSFAVDLTYLYRLRKPVND